MRGSGMDSLVGVILQLRRMRWVLILRRHVGEDDPVAGLQPVQDFDSVDGSAARPDDDARGFFAVGFEAEEADLSCWVAPKAGRPT